LSVEQDELRSLIISPSLGGQYLAPGIFRACKNCTRELPILVGRLVSCVARRGRLYVLRKSAFQQLPRIAAEQAHDRGKDQYADASAADSDSASHSSTVFDVRALPLISPAHMNLPQSKLLRSCILTLLKSADKIRVSPLHA
jgi:hypothetical protein